MLHSHSIRFWLCRLAAGVILVSWLQLSAQSSSLALFEGFWKNAEINDNGERGGSWRQSGYLPVTFVTARRQLSDWLTHRGFQQKHCLAQKKDGKQVEIALWEKGDIRVITMLSSVEISRTHFAWGEVEE